MKLKQLALGAALVVGMSAAMADNHTQANTNIMNKAGAMPATLLAAANNTAAQVITVKMPVVDTQVTQHHSTEVFMQLNNTSTTPRELIAATSPVANQVQLHMTMTQNGKSTMQQVSGITVAGKTDENLHLGGLHVMLMGMKKHLIQNSMIPITLIFNDGSWKTVNAKVQNHA